MKKTNLLKGLIGIGALALAMPAITIQASCGETPVTDHEIPVSMLTVDNDGALMLVDTEADLSPYNVLRVPATIDGKDVLSIAKEAFIKWMSLTKINFGDATKCTSIGESAFAGMYDATISVDFNAVTSIGNMAFTGAKFSDLNLGNVTTLDSKAFYNCEIKSIEIGKLATWKYNSFYFKNDFQITANGSELYKVFETIDTDGKTVAGQTIYPIKQTGINESIAGLGWGKLDLDQATSWDIDEVIHENYFSFSRLTSIKSNSILVLQTKAISFVMSLTNIEFPKLQQMQNSAVHICPGLVSVNIGNPTTLGGRIISQSPNVSKIQTTYLETPTTSSVTVTPTTFAQLLPGIFENKYNPDSNTSTPEVADFFKKEAGLVAGWTAKEFDLGEIDSTRSMKFTTVDNFFLTNTAGKVSEVEWTNEVSQIINNVYADIANITRLDISQVKEDLVVETPTYNPQWAESSWTESINHTIHLSAKDGSTTLGGKLDISIKLSTQTESSPVPASFFTVDDEKDLVLKPNIVITKAHNTLKSPDITDSFSYDRIFGLKISAESIPSFTIFSGPDIRGSNSIAIPSESFRVFSNLEFVDIKNITSIADSSFADCQKISKVHIDNVLSGIGELSFTSPILSEIIVDDNNPILKTVTTNGKGVAPYTDSGKSVGYKITGENVPQKYSGLGYGGLEITPEIISISSPGFLTNGAFFRANSLTWIGDGGSVRTIHTTFIVNCNKIVGINLPGCSENYSGSIQALPELLDLTLGAMTEILQNLVKDCPKLSKITFNCTTLPTISEKITCFTNISETGKITNKIPALQTDLLNLLKQHGLPAGWTN